MEEAITGTVYSSVPRKEMFITANIHSSVSKVVVVVITGPVYSSIPTV